MLLDANALDRLGPYDGPVRLEFSADDGQVAKVTAQLEQRRLGCLIDFV